jgi:hypothetical protein
MRRLVVGYGVGERGGGGGGGEEKSIFLTEVSTDARDFTGIETNNGPVFPH